MLSALGHVMVSLLSIFLTLSLSLSAVCSLRLHSVNSDAFSKEQMFPRISFSLFVYANLTVMHT